MLRMTWTREGVVLACAFAFAFAFGLRASDAVADDSGWALVVERAGIEVLFDYKPKK